MSNAKETAKKAIAKIESSGRVRVQGTALSILIGGVNSYIDGFKAERELIQQIPDIEKQIVELKNSTHDTELSSSKRRQIDRDIREYSNVLRQAHSARQQIVQKRKVLEDLQQQTANLDAAIQTALNSK